ncbi:hypothetical protein GCM10023264_15500 [Sphingomonas daechungensis]|uniref:DUF4760 domain-containing protein n=1 Tax=Sphingomonas daechungensis TaxID=1176646 RepID=A0ABX6T5H8_9SPHN|nr:hypothetical protein [Sphingomonas daechungensis]QNP44187.1 hypothetical protein H9L15_06730 [Sphingomonas daechungensis]
MTALQNWQPAIGSFLALIAIFIAASVGFWFNRKRDADLRKDEAKSIAAALYAEAVTLQRVTARMANLVARRHQGKGLGRRRDGFDAHFFELVPMPPASIFAGLSAQIGKLPASILLGMAEFHSTYEEARYWLPRLEDKEERGFSYSVLAVLRPALTAVEGVQSTLAEIEAFAGISPASKLPDLREAKDVFQWEEEWWTEARQQDGEGS